MWGPSEFHATGNLKDVDLSDRLAEIRLPTMMTAGRYDEATPETAAWYQSLIPGSSLEILENSSQMTMLEEPERYVEVVRNFLRGIESATAQ
jgi:proline iminopeptidase